jgi:hypothetical protein
MNFYNAFQTLITMFNECFSMIQNINIIINIKMWKIKY